MTRDKFHELDVSGDLLVSSILSSASEIPKLHFLLTDFGHGVRNRPKSVNFKYELLYGSAGEKILFYGLTGKENRKKELVVAAHRLTET